MRPALAMRRTSFFVLDGMRILSVAASVPRQAGDSLTSWRCISQVADGPLGLSHVSEIFGLPAGVPFSGDLSHCSVNGAYFSHCFVLLLLQDAFLHDDSQASPELFFLHYIDSNWKFYEIVKPPHFDKVLFSAILSPLIFVFFRCTRSLTSLLRLVWHLDLPPWCWSGLWTVRSSCRGSSTPTVTKSVWRGMACLPPRPKHLWSVMTRLPVPLNTRSYSLWKMVR